MKTDWSEKRNITSPRISVRSNSFSETLASRADQPQSTLNDGEKCPSFDMFGIMPMTECCETGDLFRLESRAGTDEDACTITTEWETRKPTASKKFLWSNQLRSLFFSSWLNILLFFIPAGFIVSYLHVKQVAVFANFIAIMPISGLLGFAMNQLMSQIGDGLTILVWITFWCVLENKSMLETRTELE